MVTPLDNSNRHSVKEELHGVLVFVGVIWVCFVVSWLMPSVRGLGVRPRELTGLPGIFTMPFLHLNWTHLVSNTLPLVFLLALLAGSRANSWMIVTGIVVLSGLLLWCFGRKEAGDQQLVHIGASGLIFGLITFLIISGMLEKRTVPLLISLVVGFFYGTTLFRGILPIGQAQEISWDGHLCGAVAGALMSYTVAKVNGRRQAASAADAEAVGGLDSGDVELDSELPHP